MLKYYYISCLEVLKKTDDKTYVPRISQEMPSIIKLRGQSTWCRVQLRPLCHPADIGFTRDLGLSQWSWCRFQCSGIWLRIDGLESTNLSEKLTAVLCYISNSTKQQMYLNCIHAAVLSRCCLLVNILQLTFSVSRNNGREGKNRSCQTQVSVTAWPTFHWSSFCFMFHL